MNKLTFNPQRVSLDLGGTPITLETGRIAKQAAGAVVVQQGGTMVLVAVCHGTPREGIDFFPLTVDYREPVFSAGKIPGGFFKREGKQTTKETMTSRLIDRPLRPLFEEGYNGDTMISAQVISFDGENQPDVLAIVGASAALIISEIPFVNPVGGVRVGRIDGKLIPNPTVSQRHDSDLDLIVAGTDEALVMVECGAKEVQEDAMVAALSFGHEQIRKLVKLQKDLQALAGRPKLGAEKTELDQDLYKTVAAAFAERLMQALTMKVKIDSYKQIDVLKKEAVAQFTAEAPEKKKDVVACFDLLKETIFRNTILKQGVRLDGRAFDQIRPLNIELGVLPAAHGSCLFTRGETQALVTATLGTLDDVQYIDGIEEEYEKKFYLHYNFPGFSVGECKPNRGPGRREIGHGMLAERSIFPMLPPPEANPYIVRVVSDITESNGSSSMATICGGTLALMDSGIQLKHPVAGVAMGLVSDGEKFVVLTDIAGQEDHYGDMDFKVAGTRKGITALQMDIKISGITREIFAAALEQARGGRMYLLDTMEKALPASRGEISPYAPRLLTIRVAEEKIRDVIGSGGKTIRALQKEYGVKIDVQDDGTVTVASSDVTAGERCLDAIRQITTVPEIGTEYLATVKRIEAYGCFAEILPGLDGLVHISELAPGRVRETTDVVKMGDKIKVKIIAIDQATGKVKLSRRQCLTPEEAAAEVERLGLTASAPAGPEGEDRPRFGFGGPRRHDGPGGGRPPRRDGGGGFRGGSGGHGGHGGPGDGK